MTKRKRKLNNEDKKEVEDTKPKSIFNEAFDVLSKGMEMIDKLTPEEKRKREANLNKYNSNINENVKRKPIKSKDAEDNDDLELDEDKDEEDKPEVVNKPIEKKGGRKKKEVKDVRGLKVNMDEETTINEEGSKADDNYELKLISNSRTMSKLVKDNKAFEGCVHYNSNYRYNLTSQSKSEVTCKTLWNRMAHIFDRAKPEDIKNKSLSDIRRVYHHYMEKGILRYKVMDSNNLVSLSFSMDTCYSTSLYYLVWDYLFMDVEGKTDELARITKIFEVYKFINNFNQMLEGEVILSEAIKDKTAHRKSKEELDESKYVLVKDMTTPTKLFKDCNGVPGVIVTVNGVDRAFSLNNFNLHSSLEFYKKLDAKFKRKSSFIQNDIRSMGTILAMYALQKYEKEYRTKKLKSEKRSYYYNEGNCFFHALKAVEPIFRSSTYESTFKDLSTPEQVNLAKKILLQHKKRLRLVGFGFSPVYKYMKKSEGVKLLIFWEHGGFIHAEGFEDGKPIEEPQAHVKVLMSRKCQIREFVIIEMDDDEVIFLEEKAKEHEEDEDNESEG